MVAANSEHQNKSLLEVKHLKKAFKSRVVVKDVSFSVQSNEVIDHCHSCLSRPMGGSRMLEPDRANDSLGHARQMKKQ